MHIPIAIAVGAGIGYLVNLTEMGLFAGF